MVPQSKDSSDEFALVDFLAKHWIMLFLAPAVIAAIVYFGATRVPPVYAATLEVPIPGEAVASLDEPAVVTALGTVGGNVSVSAAGGVITISSTEDSQEVAESEVLTTYNHISTPLIAALVMRTAAVETQRAVLASGVRTPASSDPQEIIATANLLGSLQTAEDRIRYLRFAIEQLQDNRPDINTAEQRTAAPIIAMLAAVISFLMLSMILGAKDGIIARRSVIRA